MAKRMCDSCKNRKEYFDRHTGDFEYACSKWECEYEPIFKEEEFNEESYIPDSDCSEREEEN